MVGNGKQFLVFSMALWFAGVVSVPSSHAQDENPFHLPEGALARLGNGVVSVYDGSVAYSPDGTRLAVASTLGIWLFDSGTGEEVALLLTPGPSRPRVHSVSFSPDGRTLAGGGASFQVHLWDVDKGQQTATLQGHTRVVYSVSFSPDGRMLASGSDDDTVRLWDVDNGQETATLQGHTNQVRSVSFSPDGRMLASGSDDETVRLWEVDSGQETATLQGHTNQVTSVSFSPDGTTLASVSWFGTVRLWDVGKGVPRRSLGVWGVNESVSFSPDGRTLASGGLPGTVRLWDVATGQEKTTLEGHTNGVESVSFSPDGTTLASGSWDGTVRLWDVDSGQEKATLDHTDIVESVSFSPDGRMLASGGGGRTVRLWDVDSGQQTATVEVGLVSSVSFSPDGRTLATGGPFGTVRLWDVDSGQQTATLEGQGHTAAVRSMSFSADGRILASGSGGWDGTILLWDMTPYVTPTPTAVLASPVLPAQTELLTNYPNPFNASTWIGYRLAAPGLVRLTIYNALGQPVRTLVNGFHVAGQYRVRWDARDRQGFAVGAGIYLMRLDYPTGVQTRRLLYLK